MSGARTDTEIVVDLDSLECTALAMAFACLVVGATYTASVIAVSLVKQGIPDTMNTFADSAQRTLARFTGGELSRLVFDPDNLGFPLAERLPVLHEVSAEYIADDLRSNIIVSGSNLDCVQTLSLGSELFTTESFRCDRDHRQIFLSLKRPPDAVPVQLAAVTGRGERFPANVTWPPGGTGGRFTFSPSTDVKPVTTKPATSPAVQSESDKRLAAQKEAVLDVLAVHRLKLEVSADREFREADFRARTPGPFLKICGLVLHGGSLDEPTRKALLRQLLTTPLFQENFLALDETQLTRLLEGPIDRIEAILFDPRGPGAALKSGAATASTTGAGTGGTAGPGEAQRPPQLKPSEYRDLYRADEPYRDCAGNRQKIARAAEEALSAGESSDGLDQFALVRKGRMPVVLNCPSGGRYAIESAPNLAVTCNTHAATGQTAESHKQYLQLFATFEEARKLMGKDGGAPKAIALLATEHERQPQNPYVSYLLGRAYVETQAYEEAHRLLKPLADENSNNVNYSYPCGYAFYAAGNVNQAQILLERAARGNYDASHEEIDTRADFYLAVDRAKWTARNAVGRPAEFSADGELVAKEEKPLKFLDFKQLNEPEYPSQICQRSLGILSKALIPVIDAFLQPEMRERWSTLYDRWVAEKGEKEMAELLRFLQSLSKEYSSLLKESPPACPDFGFFSLERAAGKVLLQCSAHRDIEPDGIPGLDPQIPAWQLHAVSCLLQYLQRRKNAELDECLQNQDRIATALAAWDDARKTPGLSDLTQTKLLPERSAACPASGRPRYRIDKEKRVSCRLHYAVTEFDRRMTAWPLPGSGDAGPAR